LCFLKLARNPEIEAGFTGPDIALLDHRHSKRKLADKIPPHLKIQTDAGTRQRI